MKPILSVPSLVVAAALTLTGCGNTAAPEAGNSTITTSTEEQVISGSTERLSANTKKSAEADFGTNQCDVVLGEKIDGEGAVYENGVLSVTKGGVYTISGEIADGMIYIETDENVMLKLNGVSVTNSKGAALYCYSAKNLYISLEEDTENVFTDGASYDFSGTNQLAEEDEPNAALYSKDDLILCGSGKLTVNGNYNNGISSKDDLTLESGVIDVTAVNNGIRGKDSLVLEGGEVTVTAGADGIKSANDADEGKGYLVIEGGKLTVAAGEDGIQSEKELQITGGEINVTTTGTVASGGNDMGWGGGFSGSRVDTSTDSDATSKGIKSGSAMLITGGAITVNSTDHAVHGAAEIIIDGGELSLASSMGKGISSHGNLTVNNGEIDVAQSTEGIESKAVLTINGGDIHIKASDDGLNAGGGSDSMFGGRGQSASSDGTVHELIINGGYICMNADGDGIDSNGNITVNGGTVIVSGPTNSGNGALDCGDGNYGIFVNGGILIAAGSMGMAEAPSSSATQNSLAIGFNGTLSAETTVAVTDESGNAIIIYTLEKQAQHIVISSPKLTDGMTCNVYTSGTVNGVEADGLYTDDSNFIPSGDPVYTAVVSSAVTSAGNAGAGGMGWGGGFGGGGMGGNFGGGHGGRGNADGSTPEISAPDGSMPDVSVPDGSMPDVSVPEGSMPDMSIPDGQLPNDLTPPDGTMEGGMTPPDGMTPPNGEIAEETTTTAAVQI